MGRYIVIILFSIFAALHGSQLHSAEPPSFLAQQLQKARPGDYIVTNQLGSYSLLYVQSCENSRLIVQEITIPDPLVNSKMNWREWVRTSAPGHTSWLIFEIDLQEGRLQESYDVDRREWLFLQGEDHLLVKLLNLPIKRLPEPERRRIGPPPSAGDPDHRAVWSPPQVFENCKDKSLTSVWQAQWPSDQTLLSGSKLDLYYDLRNNDFPFPVGIDIQSTHFKAHVRVVRAGRDLKVPQQKVPRRPPRFLSHLNPGYTEYKIRIQCPSYYKNHQLLAVPVGSSLEPPIQLPFKIARGETPEELVFLMTRAELESVLKKGCRYRLAFASPPYAEGYVETEATFVW